MAGTAQTPPTHGMSTGSWYPSHQRHTLGHTPGTTIHNDFAMFSEKEAKPIVAQRPFIIFGACRQLEAFKSLGFKTFDSVIDESYDTIEDKVTRWNKALDSMLSLTEKDPIRVYESLKYSLEHNKKHFEDSEWNRCLSWEHYE